ncbi:hypothetical protein [Fimbriiglobus ruber]|uniref:Uncharacterized protein n=1 Tax=Fimbriiglobus ruber TaxID=1908690 RepID=A0A225DF81_9BACT|nr:hypothetical protein [Fimbriiglobus ruber]OWK40132.1 hypothetical protein FRUB_05051 [Fimbriiglobus ruber]
MAGVPARGRHRPVPGRRRGRPEARPDRHHPRRPDAAALLAAWPRRPGADAACHPVTLAVDGGVVVRGRDEATGAVETVRLARPAVTGPTARIAVDRQVLARALALGCTTVRVAAGRPVVFAGGGRTLVTMALDPDPAAEVEPATTGIAAADLVRIPDPAPERRIAVRLESNGPPRPTGPTCRLPIRSTRWSSPRTCGRPWPMPPRKPGDWSPPEVPPEGAEGPDPGLVEPQGPPPRAGRIAVTGRLTPNTTLVTVRPSQEPEFPFPRARMPTSILPTAAADSRN